MISTAYLMNTDEQRTEEVMNDNKESRGEDDEAKKKLKC